MISAFGVDHGDYIEKGAVSEIGGHLRTGARALLDSHEHWMASRGAAAAESPIHAQMSGDAAKESFGQAKESFKAAGQTAREARGGTAAGAGVAGAGALGLGAGAIKLGRSLAARRAAKKGVQVAARAAEEGSSGGGWTRNQKIAAGAGGALGVGVLASSRRNN